MARLTRKNIKVFAENATNNGVFGSLQAGNPVTTSNVEQVQSLPAWSTGWNSATMTSEKLPPLEEFQGVQYVTTYQQAYLMQEGIPEWASTVTYYKGCLAKKVTANGFRIYNSLTDNNTNHSLSDTSNWKKVMDSDDLYAFDNNVVHLTGDETINGTKTFSGNLIKQINSLNYNGFRIQNTQITKGTAPNSSTGGQFVFQDSTDVANIGRLGGIETVYESDGDIISRLMSFQPTANSTTYASISVVYPSSGNPYTVCPTPTDTTTTSGTQIATTGWVNSTNNNVVHKNGQETINNEKTFTANLIRAHTDITKGTNPSSPVYWGVEFTDKNGQTTANRLGLLETKLHTNGDVETYITAYLNTNGSTDQTALKIVYTKSGNKYAIAPASDINDSIVTTVSKSKGTNGYFKLGNGMIVQWGRMNTTSNPERTVTFPIPFSSASSYTIVKNYQSDSDGETFDREMSFYSMTTTSAKTYSPQQDTNQFSWIAIGY